MLIVKEILLAPDFELKKTLRNLKVKLIKSKNLPKKFSFKI